MATASRSAGRTGDAATSEIARALLAAGPLLSADGSDSLSLDEALELLTTTGWALTPALLTAIPEALGLRRAPHPHVATLRRRTAGFLAPWDGPAAIVFADGQRVGALVDRNGLRPAAFAVTRDRLVAVASEAGAVPFSAAETVRRGRLGPGELLLVEPGRRAILEDAEAKAWALRALPDPRRAAPDPRGPHRAGDGDRATPARPTTSLRYLAGLDAERARLDIKTMALEGHEPLWSMGDDTPTPGRGRLDRPVADHLRQAFAQVTNPAIDPERERVVMDLRVELGRRPALLGGPPRAPRTHAPPATDRRRPRRACSTAVRRRPRHDPDARRDLGSGGGTGRTGGRARPAGRRCRRRRRGAAPTLLVLTDAAWSIDRLPIPSILATGAVHTALTAAGLRGRTDLAVSAADILDVHAMAMVLAVGATAVHPRLAIELAAELAGTRGAETLTPDRHRRPPDRRLRGRPAQDAGPDGHQRGRLVHRRRTHRRRRPRCLRRRPLLPDRGRVARPDDPRRPRRAADPPARRRPGHPGARRRARAAAARPGLRALPGRWRGAPLLAEDRRRDHAAVGRWRRRRTGVAGSDGSVAPTVDERSRATATPSPGRPPTARSRATSCASGAAAVAAPLHEVEDARSIVRRFVVSAMSVGALSPEAHQALTIGIQRAGGAANTGEGGEDPAWYVPGPDGRRHDARIKQVASARFGVTAAYLARADQLEIKIAQGSKPGEGGQLPGRKATAYIAALRRGQPGQSYISPPPHHDIYSIEDLAQLIADLRAINPAARIGVKLVASRGVGTIAAGVAKAGASYIHLSGHAGGTGASPLSSIKHVGAPWELGLAEVHQVLLRNDLRDRVALRTDGGLQTGRDLLVAALLGAEEFAFGTAALVAIGCDMARQCHLDTCPTGIATQREDLRAKFAGTPDDVVRFFTAIAEDFRRELAAVGRTLGRRDRRREPPPAPCDSGGPGRTRAGHRRDALAGHRGAAREPERRRAARSAACPASSLEARDRRRVPRPGIGRPRPVCA